MLRRFYPREYYTSTYKIDFDKYYARGFRGVIFDVDNTLVEHDAPCNGRAKELIDHLHEIGFKVLFLSNNDEERVKMFNEEAHAMYIYKAGKPSRKGYLAAMEKMGTDKDNTMFVGDQIFTDIWGANNAAIHNILVQPIAKHEEIQIVLKRIPEKFILWRYLKKHKLKGQD